MKYLLRAGHGIRQAVVPMLIVLFVGTLGAFFYVRAETIMANQLRQRLQSTASVAATQFDPTDIERIRGAEDAGSSAHRRLVLQLRHIRAMTPGARYAYLVRGTEDPAVVAFIADADQLLPPERIDRDRDGVVEDDERPAAVGETYDIADMDEFRAGFETPSVDRAVTYDRWGALISGYAPVRNGRGETVAVLGIDMNAGEFLDITRSVFSPVALVLVLIAGSMLAFFSFSVIQRRRFEALRQVDVERAALLDLAAHQLGMPLATFRWWLEILRDRDADASDEDREALDQLQLGVDRMDHIVRSLQDAANLQAGSMKYMAEAVDPVAFATEVAESMRAAFALKKQTVEIEAHGPVPSVSIDRKLISGVLNELLENARGYSPVGSVVTVRVSRAGSMARIEVIDRGCGIPAEELPRIFQKFTRGKKAYVNKPVGNGLGLYICKGIVERGGGALSLRSAEGKGTTVILDLPLAA